MWCIFWWGRNTEINGNKQRSGYVQDLYCEKYVPWKQDFFLVSLSGTLNWGGRCRKKSTFFKELTPRSRMYERRGQGGEKMYKIKTNTSHCPTKTISKTSMHPIKYNFPLWNQLWYYPVKASIPLKNFPC